MPKLTKTLVLFIILSVLITVGILLAGKVKNKTKVSNNNKVQVVASFYPLYFFASQIGGDKVEVTNITPSGAEPHDYEPTTQDVAKISTSNLLILNGHVEPWGDKVTAPKTLVAGDGLTTKQLVEDGQTIVDPHVWLSPLLAKKEVAKIFQALIKIDPKDQNYFQANATHLDQKLDEIDQAYKHGLANCQQKDIITSHAAFGYLAAEYDLNQVPIAGLSPDEEPSAKQLADVANFAKSHNVKYIFFESLVSPKLSETIATEIGAKTLVLDPLEGVSDADIKQGRDYFTVMQDNLTNLQIALQCTK